MQRHHTLVTGDTGGGKTTLMREMHDRFRGLSIWINHNDESGVAGARARGDRAIRSADRTTINLRCDSANDGAQIARQVGQDYFERTGYPWQVIVDEAQEEALPDGSSVPNTPLKRGLHQDRSHGGKWVLATQDPQDLHYTPVKQCRYMVWVGPPHPLHRGFADYFSLPRSQFPTDSYEICKFEAGATPFEWSVSYRGETKEKYG